MKKQLRGALLLVSAVVAGSMAATPMQTTQDKVEGNRLEINGKKLFASGMNLAWINFGSDVGDKSMDINSFTDKIRQIRKAGGNAMRWWLHTDAQNCPKIDATGTVTGLGVNTIKNMRSALDTAYAYGVVVDMCLFSFDLLVPGSGTGKPAYSSYNLENNYKFLTDTSKITTYLNNGLKPILDSVGDHPAVMCWEVFNEPEGMLASANWSHVTKKITQQDILRITNRVAGFVHRNSKKMVSTGIASFSYCSEYSTEKLVAAGGDPDGYLDFYMAHYYPEWQGESISPFHNPASFWKMDKPILIGEFPANDWSSSTMGPSSKQPLKSSMTSVGAFAYAYENGYIGAMSWAMTESNSFFGTYETTAPALTALFAAHKNDIMIKDVTIVELTGDLCMQAVLDLPPKTYPEAEYNKEFNFTGVDSLMVDLFLPSGSATNLTFNLVMKSTSDWLWCPTDISYTPSVTGKWVTYAAPISSFASSVAGKPLDLANVKQIIVQFYTSNETAFKGNVYIDNVRSKTAATETIIADFNKPGSTWSEYESGTNDNVQLSVVARPENTAIVTRQRSNDVSPMISVIWRANTMFVKRSVATPAQVRVLDFLGKVHAVKNLQAREQTIECGKLVSGSYLVEITQGTGVAIRNVVVP